MADATEGIHRIGSLTGTIDWNPTPLVADYVPQHVDRARTIRYSSARDRHVAWPTFSIEELAELAASGPFAMPIERIEGARDDLRIVGDGQYAWLYDGDEWKWVRGLVTDSTIIDQQPYMKIPVPLADRRALVRDLNDADLIRGAQWTMGELDRQWDRYLTRMAARNLRPRDRTFLGRVERTHLRHLPAMLMELVLRGEVDHVAAMSTATMTWTCVAATHDQPALTVRQFIETRGIGQASRRIRDADRAVTAATFDDPIAVARLGRRVASTLAYRTNRASWTAAEITRVLDAPGRVRLMPQWSVDREFTDAARQTPPTDPPTTRR